MTAACITWHSESSASEQAATEVRKEVNKLDNQTTGKAIDALLNFETVALFNNQVRPAPEASILIWPSHIIASSAHRFSPWRWY